MFAFDIYDELLSDSYFDSSRTAPLEKYTGKDAAPHFFDGVHFNWPIGVEMLKFIKLGTGSLAAGAGRRLNSPAEVAAFFDRLTARRVAYLAAHPDIAPILKSARQRAFDGDDQAAP
ncbi:MAG: hypothetical protein HY985_12665 [Magnetospirillum sp.]|nr:hypothetical protein [Magnetospirillum sp.]